jgi:hypothetical protein
MAGTRQVAGWAILLILAIRPTWADEGMWVFNNLPKQYLKDRYGFEPDDAWAEHVMKASVRFNSGGSGSFVSSTGLVLTNHHVGADTLHKISTPKHDYYHEGFLARTQSEEVKAPDLELNVLVAIENVTQPVNAAVKPEMNPSEAFAARRAVIAQIEKESFDKTGLRSNVVTLYQGGQYHLYRYKRYTDVRLVWAPEFAIAFFGGDPDNFEYPRYDLDACLFRVYEDDRPAKIDHFLRWSEDGATDGELVFVSGNPGRTSRLFTLAALQFQRDVRLPWMLDWLRREEVLLQQFSYEGIEQSRRAKEELFSIQNSRKAYTGMLQGLQNPALLADKEKAEHELRRLVQSDAKLVGYAQAWDRIAAAQKEHERIFVEYTLLERGFGVRSQLFTIARTLVRLAEEDKKPNGERLAEYRDSGRPSLEQQLYSTAPIYDDLEQVKLADALALLCERLGCEHALLRPVLSGKSPVARAAELIGGTRLKSVDERRRLAKAGQEAIDNSDDAMIRLATLVDKSARDVRKQFEEKVEEVQRQGYAQIANAIFQTRGTNVYPDATFTLRLAFGTVTGYEESGRSIPPWTTMGGAFDHEAAHARREPWRLPKSWHAAKKHIDPSTPLNFVSTADIIGGNSGSPVINRKAEVVGLIFDGNIQSLTADFIYSDEQSRAVAVHSSAIREALAKIYDAGFLAEELGK